MSHADQSRAIDVVTATRDSLRIEAEELRRQIGSENMNQSGVIASRRLDEALLRLDLATGRRRQPGSSISSTRVKVSQSKSPPRRPRSVHSAPASDLELDESIAQSSSVWLEPVEQREARYRLDPAPQQTQPPQAHTKPHIVTGPPESIEPTQRTELNDPRPASTTMNPATVREDTARPSQVSINTFTDLFGTPIDVMLTADTSDHDDREREQIVSSVSEARWKPSAESHQQTETIGQEKKISEPTDDVRLDAAVIPKTSVKVETKPVIKSDFVEPTTSRHESTPLADNVTEKVRNGVNGEVPETDDVEERAVAGESTQTLSPFEATWQVDEFVVPSTVDELFLAGSVAEQLGARLAAARTDGLHTIAVTSPKPGEGRSTVAMGMALSVAFSGLRVALVDADTKGVKLATDLQLDLENSWIDAIRTDLPLEETAVYSQADSLTLIPLLESDAELPMNVNELRRLLVKLKNSFDLVIVDCGASAVNEVALCDTALIVRDVHRTKALEVETLAMSLRRNGLQGIGVVENFCPQ